VSAIISTPVQRTSHKLSGLLDSANRA
jgi:hypothetical protein